MAVCFAESVPDARVVEGLVRERGLSPLAARVLAARGVDSGGYEAFVRPNLSSSLASLPDLPGVSGSAVLVLKHVVSGGEIVVFGDYDCDGVCATAILVKTLSAIGARVSAFIPQRLSEGYGMSDASVARMLSENPRASLVITVDNGINAVDQVAYLRAKGVDVIVTDHHLPGEALPDCPVVNPKVSSPESLEWLCGSGVAFLLSRELARLAQSRGMYSGPKISGPLTVLAGLATVTDIMPLTGFNRVIVSEALQLFRRHAPVGLLELHDRASRSAAPLTARDFGFLLGPRMNAAGRVASGMESLELVLSGDRERARELARIVDVHNVERKNIEQKMMDDAYAQIVPGASAQVIDLPGGHEGVAGIVASRVLEKIGDENPVPVCVVVRGHGSARAPEGYNLREAFSESKSALDRFGGHAAAGGVSVKDGETDRFRELFRAACRRQAERNGAPVKNEIHVDAFVTGEEITVEFADWLRELEPFGEGNPQPVFAARGVAFSELRTIGQEGRHLYASFCGGLLPGAVWWGKGGEIEKLRSARPGRYDVAFNVEVSTYGGRHPELRIVAAIPSE